VTEDTILYAADEERVTWWWSIALEQAFVWFFNTKTWECAVSHEIDFLF